MRTIQRAVFSPQHNTTRHTKLMEEYRERRPQTPEVLAGAPRQWSQPVVPAVVKTVVKNTGEKSGEKHKRKK